MGHAQGLSATLDALLSPNIKHNNLSRVNFEKKGSNRNSLFNPYKDRQFPPVPWLHQWDKDG